MKTIIVADDNPVSRELITEILEAQGYEIVQAADGGEALHKIRASTPDLVLLDIQMPVMDGFAVLEEIRRSPALADLRVVALTAFAMFGDREKAMQAGFNGYRTKPIQISALRSAVSDLLD
jgi:two-component system cell cycle response regulator DivK